MGNSNSTSTGTAPAVVSANTGPGSLGWFFPIIPAHEEVKAEDSAPAEMGNVQKESATVTVVVETPASSSVPAVPGKSGKELEEWKGKEFPVPIVATLK